MKKRIGIIGVGVIANAMHIPGYLTHDNCEITAICDINPEALNKTNLRLKLSPDCLFTDYRDLLKSDLVDAVDICTSNDVHVPIAIQALKAGFPVSLEKPIGINFEETKELEKVSKETGLPVFICFSWRYRPFLRYMKYLAENNELGNLFHIYARSIKNSGLWPNRKLEWRFQKDRAGSGVLCDLGSHLFDAIRFLGGDFESISCDTGIFIKKRQLENSEEWGEVTTDDWSNVICTLKSGVGATVNVSRMATTENERMEIEVYGEKGSMKFVSAEGKRKLYLCTGADVKTSTMREAEISAEFEATQSHSFVNMLLGKPDKYAANISEGLYSQVAVDAAILSHETGKHVKISDMF